MKKQLPSLMTMLSEIIATPSISSPSDVYDTSNQAVIEKLHSWLSDLGFQCEAIPVPDSNGSQSKNKFNLIATLGSGDGGLVLAGHTDTVPCNENLWNSDPFTLTEVDNKLYGLGTTDMKSFFPIVIEAIKLCLQQGLDKNTNLKQPIIILATADEETTMAGARSLVTQGRPKARHAIIGEPTNLTPAIAHKGMMMESIRIEGHSGHSSDPSLGVNAMEAMHSAMTSLLAWRDHLQVKHQNPLFSIPVPTLNLGCIHGGDNPNRICGVCELQFDIRPLPGMSIEELRNEITQWLKPIEQQYPGISLNVNPGLPPFSGDENCEIVNIVETLTGQKAMSVAFGTEAPYYQQLGIQPVILGPGGIAQAHQPNEFLELNTLQPMIEIVKGAITQLCL